jgi:hypothetical protein
MSAPKTDKKTNRSLTRFADGFGLQRDPGTQAATESGVALKRPA